MLRPRIVVCLLTDGESLIKTREFKSDKYLGDPLNAIKIFNELEVDELMLLDINARKNKLPPNFDLITKVAKQCRMPFGYGGGITKKEEAIRLISEGVEKVALGDPSILESSLIKDISEVIGSQSTAVIINHKLDFMRRRFIYLESGSKKSKLSIENAVDQSISLGAGEIIFYDISRDGMRSGYDLKFIDDISKKLSVPSLFLGGVGDVKHFDDALNISNSIGLGAGSFFTLFGKHRTPLISYSKPKF
tara:strand:- start:488 stop:1231 length:744 start_codon:yes stop_codon:yes gene_type:complete